MKIVLVCDEANISDNFRQTVGGQGHQVNALRGDYPLENSGLPECDAVVVEEKTWVQHASLYRYFEVLAEFNGVPFGVISRRKPSHLKARRRNADTWIPTGFSPAEALEAVAVLGRAAAA
jgi:hypothetical protein